MSNKKSTSEFKVLSPEEIKFSKLKKEEKVAYTLWKGKHRGTIDDWHIFLNNEARLNLRKINELTGDQQRGIKGVLTGPEVREYIIYLSKRNYEGGTVSEWQVFRLESKKAKKELPVVVHTNQGPQVIRTKK